MLSLFFVLSYCSQSQHTPTSMPQRQLACSNDSDDRDAFEGFDSGNPDDDEMDDDDDEVGHEEVTFYNPYYNCSNHQPVLGENRSGLQGEWQNTIVCPSFAIRTSV